PDDLRSHRERRVSVPVAGDLQGVCAHVPSLRLPLVSRGDRAYSPQMVGSWHASWHSSERVPVLTRPEPAPIRGRVFSAWSRTWSGARRQETSGSPPGSGSPSCPGP